MQRFLNINKLQKGGRTGIKVIKIENPYGFIYITTNLINGKRYIGQKQFDTKSRWKSYLGSGLYLIKAINKYGKENFIRDIVDIAFSQDELNEKEKSWITNYNAVKSIDFYNQIEGGILLDSLNRKNSIKCICINNGMVFNSLAAASIWSGYSVIKIKKTLLIVNRYEDYKNNIYIFRLLNNLNISEPICRLCGKNYTKNSNAQIMCITCSIKNGKRSKNNKVTNKKKTKQYSSPMNLLTRKSFLVLNSNNILTLNIYDKLDQQNRQVTLYSLDDFNNIFKGQKFSLIKPNKFENNMFLVEVIGV